MDLCVEKESLKQQIEEKNKLLEDAYIALDSLEKEKDELHDEVERLYSRKDANARLVNVSSSTARDCSETFLKKRGCGGGVGVACSVTENEVPGLIPGVELSFFFSVLTLIFFFSFRKIHLGRRAFSYFTVSVFSCSAS